MKHNEKCEKVGFIGAGKVGFSLGKHMTEHGIRLSGYCSKNPESAKAAAEFTDSCFYADEKELLRDSDIVFLTVPDGEIAGVWNRIKTLQPDWSDRIICHASGSLSSEIFSGIPSMHGKGFSVHPLCAVSDRYHSYKDLQQCLFTIEGEEGAARERIAALFVDCGNDYEFISSEGKALYHAAAVVVSNFVVGLSYLGEKMLQDCGFSEENCAKALLPMLVGNAKNIAQSGSVAALTGPVERNDVTTIARHLQAFAQQKDRDSQLDYELVSQLYRDMTSVLTEIGQKKHKEYDYGQLKEVLEK